MPHKERDKLVDRFATSEPFKPRAEYDPDGDCIEFFLTDEPFVGHRLDKWVTVYYGRETKDVVGSLVKNVRQLLVTFPGLDIDIKGSEVLISHILRAPAWSETDEVRRKTYKAIIEKAEASHLKSHLCVA